MIVGNLRRFVADVVVLVVGRPRRRRDRSSKPVVWIVFLEGLRLCCLLSSWHVDRRTAARPEKVYPFVDCCLCKLTGAPPRARISVQPFTLPTRLSLSAAELVSCAGIVAPEMSQHCALCTLFCRRIQTIHLLPVVLLCVARKLWIWIDCGQIPPSG